MKSQASSAKKARPSRRCDSPLGQVLPGQAAATRAAIRQTLDGPAVQARLTVGPPDDAHEREADRVADQVMRMPVPGGRVQRQCPECEEETRRRPLSVSAGPETLRRQLVPEPEDSEPERPVGSPLPYREAVEALARERILEPAAEPLVELEMSLPAANPAVDTSSTEDDLGAWERVDLVYLPGGSFETAPATGADGDQQSYVTRVTFRLLNPRFTFRIARHLEENRTRRPVDTASIIVYSRIYRHALEHLRRFRQVAANAELQVMASLAALPRRSRPLAVPQADLDAYVHDLLEYLHARLRFDLWQATCSWEQEDYPRLLRGIPNAFGVLTPRCGAAPPVPPVPLEPVPVTGHSPTPPRSTPPRPARTGTASPSSRPPEREPTGSSGRDRLRRKEHEGGTPEVTPDLEARIRSLSGQGSPLPTSTRTFFEPRFGQDFSSVRVHTGPAAAEIAGVLRAKAFTTGEDIVFASGQYEPGAGDGKRLLAHELTHVVQQGTGGSVALQKAPDRGGPTATTAPSALSAPSLLETLEIGTTELISAQLSRIALFAKKVLGLPQASLAGSILATCYWSPGAGIEAKANAERRAEEVRSALTIFGIPAEKIRASAWDASLLSPPVPPSGLVRITFFPDQFPSTRAFSMLRHQPREQPISLHLPKTAPPSVKDSPQRKGTPGDLLEVLVSLPFVKQKIDSALANAEEAFQDLPLVDQVVTVVLAADAIAGILVSSPATLELLNGVKFPVPWVKKSIKVQIFTKDGGGAVLHLDLAKLFRKRKRATQVGLE